MSFRQRQFGIPLDARNLLVELLLAVLLLVVAATAESLVHQSRDGDAGHSSCQLPAVANDMPMAHHSVMDCNGSGATR